MNSTAASATNPCRLLTSADFRALGKTLSATPIEADETAVQIKNCFYEFGSENDAVYLDAWPSPSAGKQAFDGGKNPEVGGGTPITLTGIGDSAYWLPRLHMVYVTKANKVFDVKIGETGASDIQLQTDATTLATKIASRIG